VEKAAVADHQYAWSGNRQAFAIKVSLEATNFLEKSMSSEQKPTLVYCGHHKCASTWIEDIIFYVCSELRLKYAVVFDAKDFNFDLQKYVDDNELDFVAYANAEYKYVSALRSYRGFHVVRDPRDIVVSAYFSHLHSHPTDAWEELVDYRKKLQSQNQHDGLFSEMDFRKQQFDEMRSWPEKDPNVIELKMEDLTMNAYKIFTLLFDFVGLLDTRHYGPIERFSYLFHKVMRRVEKSAGANFFPPMTKLPVERLLGVVWEHEFAKLAGGRKAGQEDVRSHYRKGVAGDWVNYLDQDHVDYFKKLYNDVILKYGYEDTPDWIAPPKSK